MMDLIANIFLGCFVFGLAASVISLVLGGDHNVMDGGSDVHGHIGADGVSTGAHGVDGLAADLGGDGATPHMSFFNMTGMMMFLTWFGATGFVLVKYSVLALALVLVLSAVMGTAGAAAIFLFYNKFLLAGETPMRARDYYLPGTLARVTSGIRAGGTGEIVYMQGGTRKTAGARSDEGAAHPLGQEVVIVRYEKGLAYVRAINTELGTGGDPALTGPGSKEV